ncbi:MAG: hypothetical protein M2R45_03472 [Verrucomicrobia subdivision 3 bacterium]|nr:hypothetical protein [Limisphaerales bacterium]MCS1416677.1 hypothetical protein [Limisphaerales bacterium]
MCLRGRVTALPVDQAANLALIELLAGFGGIKEGSIRITRGLRCRSKTVSVAVISLARFLELLEQG